MVANGYIWFFFVFYFATSIRIGNLHTFGKLPIHSIHDHDLCRITSAELPLY